MERRENPERERRRHRDQRREARQEDRVAQAPGDQLGNIAPAGQRPAEVAGQGVAQPFRVARHGGPVEPELAADGGHRFGRRGLPERLLREVARQELHRREDDDRNDPERGEAEGEPQKDQPGDRMHDA